MNFKIGDKVKLVCEDRAVYQHLIGKVFTAGFVSNVGPKTISTRFDGVGLVIFWQNQCVLFNNKIWR